MSRRRTSASPSGGIGTARRSVASRGHRHGHAGPGPVPHAHRLPHRAAAPPDPDDAMSARHHARAARIRHPVSDDDSDDDELGCCFRDRASPVLLESGLRPFLGHPYPLINGNTKPAHGGGAGGGVGPGGGAHPGALGGAANAGGVAGSAAALKELAGGLLDAAAGDKAKDDGELWNAVDAQAAFLGPNLWDKAYETDLKYVDLDEFLSENGVSMDGLGGGGGGGGGGGPLGAGMGAGLGAGQPAGHHAPPPLPKRERSVSPDCLSPGGVGPPSPADSIFSEALSMASGCRGGDFDPRTRAFSDEELKPQPLVKKSRKQFVPDDLKDDKYWARRRKNNLAAKRSRDARRMKENQIALRAGFLEKENVGLRQELERLKKENLILQNKLAKYEDV